jgi:hypothetical protein
VLRARVVERLKDDDARGLAGRLGEPQALREGDGVVVDAVSDQQARAESRHDGDRRETIELRACRRGKTVEERGRQVLTAAQDKAHRRATAGPKLRCERTRVVRWVGEPARGDQRKTLTVAPIVDERPEQCR